MRAAVRLYKYKPDAEMNIYADWTHILRLDVGKGPRYYSTKSTAKHYLINRDDPPVLYEVSEEAAKKAILNTALQVEAGRIESDENIIG